MKDLTRVVAGDFGARINMRVGLGLRGERWEFDVPDDRLVGAWEGPASLGLDAVRDRLVDALESPIDDPPLRRIVVPGDRVVLSIDPEVPDLARVVSAVAEVLLGAEVASIQGVALAPLPASERDDWPATVPLIVHEEDPAEPSSMAYLASTTAGRRVYLPRSVTEADVVVSIGLLGFDEVLGYRGPWSTLFPGLGDREARVSGRRSALGIGRRGALLDESGEVSWLLGSFFHVGVLPGARGAAGIIAGEAGAVREAGLRAIDDAWTFRTETRADLVIAGIGRPGQPNGPRELALGLSTAAALVRRGGKIAAITDVSGPIGPALGRLAAQDDPARGVAKALRGLEEEADYLEARLIGEALHWADVYLLSGLDAEIVEDLGMIPLASPAEAQRLAAAAPSLLIVDNADRTRGLVRDEDD